MCLCTVRNDMHSPTTTFCTYLLIFFKREVGWVRNIGLAMETSVICQTLYHFSVHVTTFIQMINSFWNHIKYLTVNKVHIMSTISNSEFSNSKSEFSLLIQKCFVLVFCFKIIAYLKTKSGLKFEIETRIFV